MSIQGFISKLSVNINEFRTRVDNFTKEHNHARMINNIRTKNVQDLIDDSLIRSYAIEIRFDSILNNLSNLSETLKQTGIIIIQGNLDFQAEIEKIYSENVDRLSKCIKY